MLPVPQPGDGRAALLKPDKLFPVKALACTVRLSLSALSVELCCQVSDPRGQLSQQVVFSLGEGNPFQTIWC